MNKGKILIVDDEPIALDNLQILLSREGYDIIFVENGKDALDKIKESEFDLVLTDLKMPRVDGMQILETTRDLYPDTEVIIITGYATIDSAIEAMKVGAYHYITKPYKIDEVRKLVKEALEKRSLVKENNALRNKLVKVKENTIIAEDDVMQSLLEIARNVAGSDCNILITGESGTGKELLARYIHHHSQRNNQSMLAVNCGVFGEELLASELFGYEKGAFTGAEKKKVGIIQSAEGGTLLLDEIAEMSLSMQVKLLRVLQEKEIMSVGSTKPEKVNVRFIAATNRNLSAMVSEKTFRQDLYYRINVVNLHIPPLSERRRDIPLLLHYFVDRYNVLYDKKVERVSDDVIQLLMNYDFPGNVRELEHLVERAIVLSHGSVLDLSSFPGIEVTTFRNNEGVLLTLEEYEKRYIEWVLRKSGGKKAQAAEILGIDRVSLWRKLKKFGYEGVDSEGDNIDDSESVMPFIES